MTSIVLHTSWKSHISHMTKFSKIENFIRFKFCYTSIYILLSRRLNLSWLDECHFDNVIRDIRVFIDLEMQTSRVSRFKFWSANI